MKTLNAIKADLGQHFGSESFQRHFFVKNAIASEGAMDYFQQAECFWLWDIIATDVHNVVRRMDPETHYFKIKVTGTKAKLKLKDYKGKLLWSKEIDFTTHPEGSMRLIVGWDGTYSTTCLMSEN